MKPKKVLPAPTLTPLPCVVLASDAAKRSGWAIWVRDRLYGFGEVDGFNIDEIAKVIASALMIAEICDLPCVMILEKPYGVKAGFAGHTVSGLEATRGVWKAAWLRARGAVKSRRVDVRPTRWRAKVLGKGNGNKPRDEARVLEQRAARVFVEAERQLRNSGTRGYRGSLFVPTNDEDLAQPIGEDAAPAICIGYWGVFAGEVLRKLPKGVQQEIAA